LGSPKTEDTSLSIGGDILPDWVFLLNGVRQLSENMHSPPYSGILSPIFKRGRAQIEAIRSHAAKNQDSHILERFHALTERVTAAVTNKLDLEAYQKVMKELQPHLLWVLTSPKYSLELSSAFAWAFVLDDTFRSNLKQRKQEAIAIFTHGLITIHALSWHSWLQGWSTCLLSTIWKMLDDEHRLWIQWPIEEMGWVPPS
jgi:hypothetical protein